MVLMAECVLPNNILEVLSLTQENDLFPEWVEDCESFDTLYYTTPYRKHAMMNLKFPLMMDTRELASRVSSIFCDEKNSLIDFIYDLEDKNFGRKLDEPKKGYTRAKIITNGF